MVDPLHTALTLASWMVPGFSTHVVVILLTTVTAIATNAATNTSTATTTGVGISLVCVQSLVLSISVLSQKIC